MKYHLFEVVGIELEYMLVQKQNLNILPIVDQLFKRKTGELLSDVDNGLISWSNELVTHVVELKTNGPQVLDIHLADQFYENIYEINKLLHEHGACLLGTAMHPFLNPDHTSIWPHDYNEVYNLYNRIFNCKGHGWSNVQSSHLNLPFYDDSEFERLHAAVRILLPILPALSASSPIVEGKVTGKNDTRLWYYKSNQAKIPQLTGKVIPEAVFTKADYEESIFKPINVAIAPFDDNKILSHHFLNSRGAIARFDRNAIEIRIIDNQECVKADVYLIVFLTAILKSMVQENIAPLQEQKKQQESKLYKLFNEIIETGEDTMIYDEEYLKLFGFSAPITVKQLWQHLFKSVQEKLPAGVVDYLDIIFDHGNLSRRILNKIGAETSQKRITMVYKELASCLARNTFFV